MRLAERVVLTGGDHGESRPNAEEPLRAGGRLAPVMRHFQELRRECIAPGRESALDRCLDVAGKQRATRPCSSRNTSESLFLAESVSAELSGQRTRPLAPSQENCSPRM